MTFVPASLRRDWHQFRLLSRDATRQLIDTALFSRDSDPMEFALWMLALLATPPAFFAARQVMIYTSLTNAPLEVVQRVALGHRLFFVAYGMLAAALLAALTWETLFPDGRDQEIIGVLPVRPQTHAAARLGAAATLGVVVTAVVNVPAAAIYTMMSAGHPLFRSLIPQLALGHVLATMCGSLFVFFALLAVRGVTAIVLGARAGAWLGAALQLVTVILLVEVFFFLPGILSQIVDAMLSGSPQANALPPAWFASLHAWMAGDAHPVIAAGAGLAVMVFVISALVLLPIYLLPARWLGNRALESRPPEHKAGITSVFKWIAGLLGASPSVRGIFVFAIASLLRSRRHLLVLTTYFGMAIAISIISLLSNDVEGYVPSTPASWVLAIPMVFIFFMVLGLRATFRIPTEIEANWPFRLSQPTLATCVNAAVLVMFALAVLPIALLTFAVIAPVWPMPSALMASALQALAGVMFVECMLFHWTKVPFACGHSPSPDVLKSWWPVYLMAMYVFAFRLASWQLAALSSPRALAWYVTVMLTVIVVVRVLRYRKLRSQSLQFEPAPNHTVERLNLSEALN
jgi:hypothetical protein